MALTVIDQLRKVKLNHVYAYLYWALIVFWAICPINWPIILLYALTAQQWSLYIPFSNMLIWLSNGLKLFINLAFDEEFRRVFKNTFYIAFRKPRIMVSSSYGIASTAVKFTKRNNN